MGTGMEAFNEAVEFLQAQGVQSPEIGVVLGTGLSALVEHVQNRITIEYSRIPHFAPATVEFHKGKLIFGDLAGKKIVVLQGRFHFYEGHSMAQIVFPMRVLKLLGIQALYLSNVSGGINPNFKKGDLVLLDDHINLQSSNPLIGPNLDALGGRFPDMSRPYSPELGQRLQRAAQALGFTLKQGVYAAVNGPQLETRAEYRYLKTIGADMVGMSTVPEVIAANHMGLPCAVLSIITDECDPDHLAPISVPEILEIAGQADMKMAKIFLRAFAG